MTEDEDETIDIDDVSGSGSDSDWFMTHEGFIVFPHGAGVFADGVGAAALRVKSAKTGDIECLIGDGNGRFDWRPVTKLAKSGEVLSLITRGKEDDKT